MRLKPIIKSLLETDMYKFSMGQGIFHQFPEYMTTWAFKCRNTDVTFTAEMVDEIKEQIRAYCDLRFTEDELKYLDSIRWIKGSYINFLRLWHSRFEDFTITNDGPCGLSIETAGTWLNTSMYEIPTLAIVNEVYFKMNYDYKHLITSFADRLDIKFDMVKTGKFYLGNFSEFGLRRRLSAEAQELCIEKFSHLNDTMHSASHFVGTSNVLLAKEFGITPVGTMAHEWIMGVGQGDHSHNPAYSNYFALKAWVGEYETDNGIALTDTAGSKVFRKDFNRTFATLFSGIRHDSGDPFQWGRDHIEHYKSLGIDPKNKTLLFSDSLNFEKADKICRYFMKETNPAFGIGTYMSNDTDVRPLNIVMKMVKCNGQPVAKLSDDEGKEMCLDPDYLRYFRSSVDWRLAHEK